MKIAPFSTRAGFRLWAEYSDELRRVELALESGIDRQRIL
jgi:hypothetical protein